MKTILTCFIIGQFGGSWLRRCTPYDLLWRNISHNAILSEELVQAIFQRYHAIIQRFISQPEIATSTKQDQGKKRRPDWGKKIAKRTWFRGAWFFRDIHFRLQRRADPMLEENIWNALISKRSFYILEGAHRAQITYMGQSMTHLFF